MTPLAIAARDLLRRQPGAPHTQQPDPVEPHSSQTIQFCIRNVVERRGPTEDPRQLRQPDTSVDLIQRRVMRFLHILRSSAVAAWLSQGWLGVSYDSRFLGNFWSLVCFCPAMQV